MLLPLNGEAPVLLGVCRFNGDKVGCAPFMLLLSLCQTFQHNC